VLYEDLWGVAEKNVFHSMWKSPAPSKVIAFGWRVLLGRALTRVNLALRNALPPDRSTLCVMCNKRDETAIHLLMHCDVVSLVWSQLMTWFDCRFITPSNIFVHWECWSGGGRDINNLGNLKKEEQQDFQGVSL